MKLQVGQFALGRWANNLFFHNITNHFYLQYSPILQYITISIIIKTLKAKNIIPSMPTPKQTHLNNMTKLYTFFSSHQSYQAQQLTYKTSIQQHNNEIILSVIITIGNILNDEQIDPYAKLLAMRFVRECMTCAGYAFFTLVNSTLREIFMNVAMFRKACQEEDRGQELFLGYKGTKYDEIYLRRLGLSFHKIILQMYQSLSTIIPSCPYNPTHHPIPSQFSTNYNLLKSLQITFPAAKTYFKQPHLSKIESSYLAQQTSELEHVPQFYKYLLSLLCEPELYKQVKLICLAIIQSGDQYCVGYMMEYLGELVGSMVQGGGSGVDYIDVIDGMVRTGDVQSIWKIQTHLLPKLLQAYRKDVIREQQMIRIAGWGGIMEKIQGSLFDFQGYVMVTRQIGRVKDRDPSKQAVKLFSDHLDKIKQHNIIKLKYMQKDRKTIEHISQLLKQIKQQNEVSVYKIQIKDKTIISAQPVRRLVKQFPVPTANQQNKLQSSLLSQNKDQLGESKIMSMKGESKLYDSKLRRKQRSVFIEILPDREQFSQYLKTPKPKISTRFLQSNNKNYSSLRQSQKSIKIPSQHENTSNQQLKTPKNTSQLKLKSIHMSENSKLRKSSFDSYSIAQTYVGNRDINTSGKKVSNEEYYGYGYTEGKKGERDGRDKKVLEDLEDQIKVRIQKQRQLELQLKRKDQLIKKLTAENSQKSFPSSSNLQHSKRHSFDSNSKLTQSNIKKSSNLLQQPSSTTTTQQYKYKKHLLKKKILIHSNSALQIGLITTMNNNIMQCSFFCTALVSLRDFAARVQCHCGWLENRTNRVQYKDRIDVQVQCVIRVDLVCGYKGEMVGIGARKPELEISYKNQKTGQTTKNLKIQLPIHINKICQTKPLNLQHYHSLYQTKKTQNPRKIQYSELIPIDYRICRNFDTFIKYFPQGARLSDMKTFVALLEFYKGRFYLEAKIIKRNQAVLRVITEEQDQGSLVVIQRMFLAYKELLSL